MYFFIKKAHIFAIRKAPSEGLVEKITSSLLKFPKIFFV